MSAHSDQMDAATAGVVYLVEMQFTTGTVRLCTWTHALDRMSVSWQGAGRLLSVSPLQDMEGGGQYPAMDIGLAVQDASLLALARGNVATYRSQPVKIYLSAFNDALQPVGEPELAWAGQMEQVRMRTGDGKKNPAMAVMRCELHGRDKRAPQTLRLNDAQHQARWPGDTFLSRVEELAGRPIPWLSVKFQHRD